MTPDPWVPVHDVPRKASREHWNWLGASPEVRRGRESLTEGSIPRRVARAAAFLVLVLVTLLVGANFVATIQTFLGVGEDDTEGEGPKMSRETLLINVVAGLIIFVVPPLFWVFAFYRGGYRAWRTRLFFRTDRLFGDFGWGVIGGFGIIVGAIIVSLVVQALVEQPDNEVVQEYGRLVDWRLVFLISLSAGVGEEIFFRAFLQPRIGIVPANVLFGLIHLNYGTPLQVVIPAVMGFVFSWMTIRRGSIVPAIVAHFTFDLIMLSLAKLSFG